MEKIYYTPFGIASRQGNKIFINKRFREHPELLERILEHEKAHSDKYNLRDIKMDLKNKHLRGRKLEFYSFILKNPSTWTEFIPFSYRRGVFGINITLLLFYLVLGLILGGLLCL